jgi:hypothetical protein
MELAELMQQHRDAVLARAVESVKRARLGHYASEPSTTRERLAQLHDQLVRAVRDRSLVAVMEYAEELAHERFSEGFGLAEVQTAINVLEEEIWRDLVHVLPRAQLAEALGLVSTVLGAAKDRLACAWVAHAAGVTPRSLDLSALFAHSSG